MLFRDSVIDYILEVCIGKSIIDNHLSDRLRFAMHVLPRGIVLDGSTDTSAHHTPLIPLGAQLLPPLRTSVSWSYALVANYSSCAFIVRRDSKNTAILFQTSKKHLAVRKTVCTRHKSN